MPSLVKGPKIPPSALKKDYLFFSRKDAFIFGFRHYLFLKAKTFARASLPQNCSHLSTDNVREKISVLVFTANRGYCLYATWHHYVSFKVVFRLARVELIEFLL